MGDAIASGGRPESETDTPVNIGNGPYRDNGEGVAGAPPPYPLPLLTALERAVAGPPFYQHAAPDGAATRARGSEKARGFIAIILSAVLLASPSPRTAFI